MESQDSGALNWRLSAHPITLLCYLGFRIGSLLMYLFGVWFIKNFILVFILTLLLLSIDFYYLKNIAGRRLVGLRWWNEVDTATGDSHWVFESADPAVRNTSNGGVNATDKRFFWLSMYVAPALWIALGVLAMLRLDSVIWLSLIGVEEEGQMSRRRGEEEGERVVVGLAIALVLTITNTVAFSRCDKFSQASSLASRALNTGGFARNIAGNVMGRFFRS